MASDEVRMIFPDIQYCENLYNSLMDSYCAIICTNWKEFCKIDLTILKKKMKNPMIIDDRNILLLEEAKKINGLEYYLCSQRDRRL